MTDNVIPAHVIPYVEALGQDKAFEFLMEFGGSVAYLSENPRQTSDLAGVIGTDGVIALASKLGTGPLRIPTAKPYLAAVLEQRGDNRQLIARRLHVSDVTVRKWLNKPGRDDQMKLFG